MQIVAVRNQKGGVGKTTLTINLGAALARLDQRVLLVDLDPQGHLTEEVGLGEAYPAEQASLYRALVGPDKAVTVGIDQFLHPPPTEPFAVIPSSYELSSPVLPSPPARWSPTRAIQWPRYPCCISTRRCGKNC